jgi:hypothetical protein
LQDLIFLPSRSVVTVGRAAGSTMAAAAAATRKAELPYYAARTHRFTDAQQCRAKPTIDLPHEPPRDVGGLQRGALSG